MGAPKQKWTPEEEAALRAGVLKRGPGKWRTILKDPEFSCVLCLRSNVDLKDKWRNMSVMDNGLGSRERARVAFKRMNQAAKQEENPNAISSVTQSEDDTPDPRPSATSSGSPQIGGSKRSFIRLDNLIMEAINNLKEPGGSSKTTIAAYIEDEYWAPPNFKRLLSSKMKNLTTTGKLIKMKRKYRIAPTTALSNKRRKPSYPLLEGPPLEGRQRVSPVIDRDGSAPITKSDIDIELAKIRDMTQQEAAAAAAQAVAEAEAAIAEAEEAAREAEAAEADAEAAMAFAEAAMKTLRGRSAPRMMVRA